MFVVPKGKIFITQDKGTDSASDEASQIQSDGETVEEQSAAIASVSSQAASLLDPNVSNVQYQFRAESGQGGALTYRVVQLTQGPEASDGSGQVVTTAATLVAPQVAQAIITSPFSTNNGSGSPDIDGQEEEEAKFTYFPAVSAATGADGTTITATPETAALAASATGQFYVMMSPQEVLQTAGQRALAPRTHQYSPRLEGHKTARDERRRATHNEVERRRRDKINNWIIKLSKIVPDCNADHTKQGQVSSTSKGGILAKACDYIQELRNTNARLPDLLKENESLTVEVELLRQQCEEMKNENQVLRAHLQQNGITISSDIDSNAS